MVMQVLRAIGDVACALIILSPAAIAVYVFAEAWRKRGGRRA